MAIRSAESAAYAEKLCEATKGLSLDKAEIAGMMVEAFINGMHVQERMTADTTPQRAQT